MVSSASTCRARRNRRTRSGFVPRPPSAAGDHRRSPIRSGIVSASQDGGRWRPPQRFVPVDRIPTPAADALGFRFACRTCRHPGVGTFGVLRSESSLPGSRGGGVSGPGRLSRTLCGPGDARGFLQSYVATYLERDLRQLLEVSSLRDYERFLRASALRSAQLLNRSDLARDIGVAGSTLSSWLAVLEASHQLVLLEPWYGKPTVSLVKRPKLYLRDAGPAAFLCSVHSADDLRAAPSAGALWETLVCAEIRRSQAGRHGSWNLHFWRDRSREADFLVPRAGRLHLADAKWTVHPRTRTWRRCARCSTYCPPLRPGRSRWCAGRPMRTRWRMMSPPCPLTG